MSASPSMARPRCIESWAISGQVSPHRRPDAARRFAAAARMRRRSTAWKPRPAGRGMERKKCPAASCGKDAVAWSAPLPEPRKDASQKYSQPPRAAQVFRHTRGSASWTMRRTRRSSRSIASPGSTAWRSARDEAATVPVRAALEHRGVLRLRDAGGGLPDLYSDGYPSLRSPSDSAEETPLKRSVEHGYEGLQVRLWRVHTAVMT